MKQRFLATLLATVGLLTIPLQATSALTPLPINAQAIMNKPAYQHGLWGVYVKDMSTGNVLHQNNIDRLMIPASASKFITVMALLNQFGFNYQFKTPVYALGSIDARGILTGDLVLVAKGDLVLGGRVTNQRISYTNFDHIDANHLPGATLTKEDPLAGLDALAKQVKAHGIHEINGEVRIDDSFFETYSKRENVISPIMINENLYDVEVSPTLLDQHANISLRPRLTTTNVINRVITVAKDKPSAITITRDDAHDQFTVTGTIALGSQPIVNTDTIENPTSFARKAFIEALRRQGIQVNIPSSTMSHAFNQQQYTHLQPIAILISPPLIEYVKLILKVSHNMGANLIPALLATAHGETTYQAGMQYLGEFITKKLHIDQSEISFGDAAGGNDNYVTPTAMMKLLEYVYHQPSQQFHDILHTLPIMGVDGSLSIVATNTPAKGHVFAKTGTGIIYNMLFGKFLLTSKALAGFYQAKNQHWIGFFIVVNQGTLNAIDDIFAINNDLGLIANELYVEAI